MTAPVADPHRLHRFVEAQDPVIDQVREELQSGCKRSHWMWFVFPQIAGLGSSAMARRYAIASLEEARAYLCHPVLGPRLLECTRLVNRIESRSLHQIFGAPDDAKFCSSMTLFAHASPAETIFRDALHRYGGGAFDRRTVDLLQAPRA